MKDKVVISKQLTNFVIKIGKTNTHKSTIIGMYDFPIPELLKKKEEKEV